MKRDSEMINLISNQIRKVQFILSKDIEDEKNDLCSVSALISCAYFLNQELQNQLISSVLQSSRGNDLKSNACCSILLQYAKENDAALNTVASMIELKLKKNSLSFEWILLTCELVAVKPSRFLQMIPKLYEIIVAESENWIIIKILKMVF